MPANVAEGKTNTRVDRAVRRVRRTLEDAGANLAGRRVLAMCSGGIDSTTLVAILARLARGAAPATIDVLWLDHGYRDDVEDERVAAMRVAESVGASFHAQRSDGAIARGMGLQGDARAWRYAVAIEEALAHECDVIVTGHTASDQLEHALLALTGVIGDGDVASMPVCRPMDSGIALVRPLLALTRTQVEALARDLGVRWAEDPTNADPDAAIRNGIRHDVVPALLAAHPGAGAALARAAARAADALSIRTSLAEGLLDAWRVVDASPLDVRQLLPLAPGARREVIAAWLRSAGVGRALTARLVRAVEQLAVAPGRAACAALDLPDGARVRRDGYDLSHHHAPRTGGSQP